MATVQASQRPSLQLSSSPPRCVPTPRSILLCSNRPHHAQQAGQASSSKQSSSPQPASWLSIVLHCRRVLSVQAQRPFVAGSSDGLCAFSPSTLCRQSSSPPGSKLPGASSSKDRRHHRSSKAASEHPPPTQSSSPPKAASCFGSILLQTGSRSDGPSGSCPRQKRDLVVAGSSLTVSLLAAEEPYVLAAVDGRRDPVLEEGKTWSSQAPP